jgi:hypothetical protein
MGDVGIFYGHLVYSTSWLFGIFSKLHQEKSGNPVNLDPDFFLTDNQFFFS